MSQPSVQPSGSKEPTPTGKFVKAVLLHFWEPLDLVGRALMGSLWEDVYLSIQDSIALSILLQLPGFIARLIIGKDFSGFSACLDEDASGVLRYACFIIVISDFCLWIVLAGRIIGRFWADLSEWKIWQMLHNLLKGSGQIIRRFWGRFT